MTFLIPLIVIALILAVARFATDSRDGRDWSGPIIDQHGYRIGHPANYTARTPEPPAALTPASGAVAPQCC